MNKKILIAIIVLVIAAVALVGYELWYLHKVHSSFENYYAFRGCTRLVSRTDTEGVCQTASGQTMKIVQFQNRWYLNGDLPHCWFFGRCF